MPHGSYTVEAVSEGYNYTYQNDATTPLTITVRDGENYPFNIKAEIHADGRPPRITTTSFNYEAGTGPVIGDLKAVDDDDSKATFKWSGTNDDLHVTTAGELRWVGAPKSHRSSGSNRYTLGVTVVSSDASSNESDAEITVTVTPSDNVVVTLKLNPASISEAGGRSTVTATLEDPASSEFYVTVSATGSGTEVNLSSNRTLTIRKGDKSSSGPPVTITAINDDNSYDPGAKSDGYKRSVTVSGVISPRDDDMEVKNAKLLIEDDDLAYGKIVLKLAKTSISETTDDNNSTTVTAEVVGGVPFPRPVTVTVEVTAGAQELTGDAATIIIPGGKRTSVGGDSNAEVTITAADDENDVNTPVTVMGTATWDDDDDAGTDPKQVSEASQPDDVYLTVVDDDDAPGMPRNVSSVSDVSTTGFTLSWEAPSSLGTLDGTDGNANNITYQVRYTTTSEANDPTTTDAEWDVQWAAQTSPHEVTGVTLVVNRSYTVQVRTVLTVGGETLASGSVTRTFTVPSGS